MGTARLVPAKAGEETELYAVELNGLHCGLKMKFTYKQKRRWDYKTRKYIEAGTKTKTEFIHKIIHNNGNSVSLVNLSEDKERKNNGWYWNPKYIPTTYNVPLDTKVLIYLPKDAK